VPTKLFVKGTPLFYAEPAMRAPSLILSALLITVLSCDDSSDSARKSLDASVSGANPTLDAAVDIASPVASFMDAGTPDAAVSGDAKTADATVEQPGLSCSDFRAKPVPTAPTNVRLKNDSAQNIFIGQKGDVCLSDLPFKVFDAQKSELNPTRGECDLTCAEAMESDCKCKSNRVCVVTLIAPGGYLDVGWPGTVFRSKLMPATCYQKASCAMDSCLVEEPIPSGELTLEAKAYAEPVCVNGPCSICTPGARGNCTVSAATKVSGTSVKATATVAQGVVILSFK
jgi:hypothetical protein